MHYKLKISRAQIIKDLTKLVKNHETNKVDQNPKYPDMMSKFESSMEIKDYFFYNHEDVTLLELHEYANGGYGFYFNHRSDGRDSYQPIVKTRNKADVFKEQVIEDIYNHLVNHIQFMNEL
jgi:hypothetical protein